MPRKKTKINLIILIFAILHVITNILCGILGIEDTILLTVLTMAMTVIICVRENLNIEFIAICVVLVNVLGYILGISIANVLNLLLNKSMFSGAVSTFLTTSILGFSLSWFSNIYSEKDDNESISIKDHRIRLLISAVLAIFVARVSLQIIIQSGVFQRGNMLTVMSEYLSNSLVLLAMTCVTLILIHHQKNEKNQLKSTDRFIISIIFILSISTIFALIVGYGLPFHINTNFSFHGFVEIFIVATICEITIYSITYLLHYAFSARQKMEAERVKASFAKTQYINLKQLVNPHFLFNTLNALDCLIADKRNDEARKYVQKLSGMYRFMLRNESEHLIKLSEEIEYVKMYIELMKLRFSGGVQFEIDIRNEDLDRYVVIYSIQMLIENASKHNIISEDNPLNIKIISNGESIEVINDLRLRNFKPESTGIGLNYIRKNYSDMVNREIVVEQTENSYRVSLPLL